MKMEINNEQIDSIKEVIKELELARDLEASYEQVDEAIDNAVSLFDEILQTLAEA